jgi:hypothetical protein
MPEDKCVKCNAPIPDGGTWGYCDNCWDDDLMGNQSVANNHAETKRENN